MNSTGQKRRNWVVTAVLNLPEIVACTLLALMSIIVVLQVFYRYVLQAPISWSEEVATFSFIWLSILSAALGVKYGVHFSLDVVVKRFPKPVQAALRLVGVLTISGMLVILFWYGLNLVGLNQSQISPALGMPMSIPYLSVPVGSALMLIYLWMGFLLRGRQSEPDDSVVAST